MNLEQLAEKLEAKYPGATIAIHEVRNGYKVEVWKTEASA